LQATHSWILGKFIVPVSRLAEFEQALPQIARDARPSRWELSALLGPDPAGDVARIREFNEQAASKTAPAGMIKSIEARIATPDDVARLSAIIPPEFDTFLEVPLSGEERESIRAIAGCGRRAKIRTGGETPDKFPSPESVVEFLRLCAEANVPFKATAGLHHPLRSCHRLTYKDDSPSGVMHGFLNMFLGAAFVHAGMEPKPAADLLREESAQAFHFGLGGVHWQSHHLSANGLAQARKNFSLSFGSCSFTEPVDDLRALHLL
jgi:hypothetical protein